MAESLLYEVRCIFCKRLHRSFFWDELEEELLRCRDEAQNWQKGLLSDFEDPKFKPISPETAAYADGYV